MNIQPLRDKILVRPILEENKTDSGLYIPETASKEKPQEGEVLAVGGGKKNDQGNLIPLDVKVGDKVLFSKYAPTEIKYEGEELYILSENDILAIIK